MDNAEATMAGPYTKDFVLTRVFDAPRALVYKAWTEADRLEQWWGPIGLKLEVVSLDVRPNGMFHYSMALPNGQKMWGRFIYTEVQAPDRICYINSFSDEEGGITRPPFSDTWPLEIANTLTFTEEDGKTRLTLRGRPMNATAEEIKTFEEGFGSLQKGFTGTLDQLEEYLKKSGN